MELGPVHAAIARQWDLEAVKFPPSLVANSNAVWTRIVLLEQERLQMYKAFHGVAEEQPRSSQDMPTVQKRK